MKVLGITFLAALALVSISASPNAGAGAKESETAPRMASPAGYLQLVLIKDESGVPRASAITATDWYKDRLIKRVLVKTPAGEHLVLTGWESPLDGTIRRTILDEDTGWQAVLEETTGLKFDRAQQIADPGAVALKFGDEEKPRKAVLTAPGLKEPFAHASTTWASDFFDTMFNVMSAQGEARRLVQAMKPATQRAIVFLDSLARCGDCSSSLEQMEPLLRILNQAIQEEAKPPFDASAEYRTWQLEHEAGARSASTLSTDARELLSEFSSVSAQDPLHDLRPKSHGAKGKAQPGPQPR